MIAFKSTYIVSDVRCKEDEMAKAKGIIGISFEDFQNRLVSFAGESKDEIKTRYTGNEPD